MNNYIPNNVLITGATSGFGKAFADKFDKIGVKKIYLHARNLEKAEKIKAELSCEVEIVICDLTDNDAIDKAFSNLPAIDLLINNAGGALGMDKTQDSNLEDWDTMISTNVTSMVRITRLLLPNMVKQKRGHIINIASIAGNWPYPMGNVYCASKAFVKQFTLAMRSDLLGTNVRATSIEPGMAETEFSLKRFKGDVDKANQIYAGTRPLYAEDIADTVLFTATLPEHVNITSMEVMPTDQVNGPLLVHRGE